MTAREHAEQDADGSHPEGEDDQQAVDMSRDELVAEADQFLDLSGADPETHGAAPASEQ